MNRFFGGVRVVSKPSRVLLIACNPLAADREDACSQDIVLVGDAHYLEREWPLLQNFPRVFALDGSVHERANLRAVNVTRCAMCIVASAEAAGGRDAAAITRSSELVLCTINIQSMPRSARFAAAVALAPAATLPRQQIDRLGHSVHILTEIGALLLLSSFFFGRFCVFPTRSRSHAGEEHSGTFLKRRGPMQLSDLLSPRRDKPQKEHLHSLESFACGRVFSATILESLMPTVRLRRFSVLLYAGVQLILLLIPAGILQSGHAALHSSALYRRQQHCSARTNHC